MKQTNQQLAEKWHWVAFALAAILAAWEVYGLWGHYMLRRRKDGRDHNGSRRPTA